MTVLPFDEWSLCVASGGQAPIEGVVGTQPLIGGSAELDRPRARAVARREFGCVFGERDVRVAGLSMATPGR
jgi:hypothetical protein